MSKAKKKTKGRHPILAVTTVVSLVTAILAAIFIWYLMGRYEDGILDVCATQQDGYVQLVVDQINLKANRDSEEIITNILGTLDASSNKYWTFSRDQAMLFVKDVLETNKYKGFTTATYYVSDSARDFLENLRQDRVTHSEIVIDEKEYIASGVIFNYQGESYRLCLLTNRSVLLDNNIFLGHKVNLLTTVAIVLLLLIVVPMIFARQVRRLEIDLAAREEDLLELNRRLELLNKRLDERDLHDTRFNLWRQDSIREFLEKLAQRDAEPVSVMELKCADAGVRETVLTHAHYTLDRQVLRFEYGEHDLLLVFIRVAPDVALTSVMPLLARGAELGRKYVSDEDGGFDPEKVCKKFDIEFKTEE